MALLKRRDWIALALGLCAMLSGCGTPGAPQPPSLNLPDSVNDLSAVRAGNQVTLTWTMPKRNTDKTMIKAEVPVRICRREGNGPCDPAGPDQAAMPGAAGSFTETLATTLSSGVPRPISYFVELRNKKGRSAGLSNAAVILAGGVPGPVEELKAEVRKQGVVLSWTAGVEKAAVRLERKLLTQAPKSERGLTAPAPEVAKQDLIVDTGTEQGRAIDKTVRFGEKYQYRAQRVARVEVSGKTLELDGAFSKPVDVDVQDVFPPTVPTGLVAVATQGENGSAPAVDLSWQPGEEPDLTGYVVYRREAGGEWQRVSGDTSVAEPAFHDTQVKAGHTYQYAVSAVDKGGHESARSVEAQETVPQQ